MIIIWFNFADKARGEPSGEDGQPVGNYDYITLSTGNSSQVAALI